MACLVFVTVSFTLGFVIGRQQGVRSVVPEGEGRVLSQGEIPRYLAQDVDFDLFWTAWDLVKDKYYEQPVSETSLFYGAMHGLLGALEDPHTVFFNPEETEEFNQELEGSFEGIGAEIGIKDDQLQIVAPLADSPAETAGVLPGDKIYFIDGVETTNMTVEEAVMRIRGDKGTTVVLTVSRDGLAELQDISIVRDEIVIDSVSYEIRSDGIAVIEIFFFNEDTVGLFNGAVKEILTQDVEGVILDLRSNPGGLLTAAVEVASEWVGSEVVVIQDVRGEQNGLVGLDPAWLAGLPTVVLVNQGSASGSEIVAGALQDYDLATLVGMTTFGKGSVQDYQELPDGSAIKITVAEWLTPNGRSINEQGIEPDIEIDYTIEDYYAGADPQLAKAVEVILYGWEETVE